MMILKALQVSGLGVVDVGARDGFHPSLLEWAPLVHLVGFEPDVEAWRRLQGQATDPLPFRSIRYLPWALSDTDGTRTLHVCRSRAVSSLCRPNRTFLDQFPNAERFDVVQTCEIPVRSLNSLVRDTDAVMPPYIGLIKVDTQGSELDVLRGASGLLNEQVVGVEVEVEFSPMYEAQPLFRDVDTYLAGLGFSLFKLHRLHWVRTSEEMVAEANAGQLVFADAVYLKHPVQEQARGLTAQQAQALIVVALLYDLHDVALEVASSPGLAREPDTASVREMIVRRSRRLGRRGGLGNLMGLLRGLRMVAKDWDFLKHQFPFMRQYPQTWARGDGDLHSRLRRADGRPLTMLAHVRTKGSDSA